MKVTIQNDEQILKDGEPDIQTVSIERNVGPTLDDVLPLLEDCLRGLGYRFDGTLLIVEDEDTVKDEDLTNDEEDTV